MNRLGGQWIPPHQPPTGPFPHQQPGPTGPPWAPGPTPSRNRGALIIGGAVVAAAAIVSTTLVLTRPDPQPAPTAAPATPTTESATATTTSGVTSSPQAAPVGPVYRVVPQTALPPAADMQRLTGIAMTANGDPTSTPVADANPEPARCMFAVNSVTQSSWKSARAMATQHYLEGTIDNYTAQADTGLAVFANSPDAAASLSLVAGSVRSCTNYAMADWNPRLPSTSWTVGDVDKGDDHITWTTTAANGTTCRRSYRIVGNLAANGLVCGPTVAAGSATALTDTVLGNAAKQ